MSHQLLLELCRRSLEEYNQKVSFETSAKQVRRSETGSIKNTATVTTNSAVLVAGESGKGKSTLALHAIEEMIQEGTLAIWLPPKYLGLGVPFHAALGNWLLTLSSKIETSAGQEALNVAATNGGLRVFVDDINRADDSVASLQNILAQSTPRLISTASAGQRQEPQALTFIVPVWPSLLQHVEQKLDKKPWIRILSVKELEPHQSVDVIRSAAPQITELEAEEFSERLGNDPFLVGNFSASVDSSTSVAEMTTVCRDVIGYVFSQAASRVARSSNGQFLEPEIQSSLVCLGAAMLKNRCLTPLWSQVEAWLDGSPRQVQAIRHIVSDEELCRLDADGHVVFRHDRFRDQMLAESGVVVLNECSASVISDPFFARTFGQTIANNPSCSANLEMLRTLNPLALFEAIRFFGEPTTDHHRLIIREIERWCDESQATLIDSIIDAISFSLLETDSSVVVHLVERFRVNWITLLAGFRNGDLSCGIRYFKTHLNFSFEPGRGNSQRDRIVEHVQKRFLPKLQEQILSLDLDKLAKDAAGLLILIGHIMPVGMDEVICKLWEVNKTSHLPHAIWSACRCPLKDADKLLRPMADHLQSLPVRTDYEKSPTHRERLVRELSWAFGRGISADATKFLISQEIEIKEYRRSIVQLIEQVDHPDSLEFLVHRLAEGYRSSKWYSLDGIGDNPLMREPFSQRSAERLWKIWTDDDEDEKVRNQAFSLWLIISPEVSIAQLQKISLDEPFAGSALQFRILSGDFTATEGLIAKITYDGWWWVLAHHIWGESLEAELENQLAKLETSADFSSSSSKLEFWLAPVLRMIRPANAERLLAKHWGHLKYCKAMFGVALRLGTPKSVELAKQSFSLSSKPQEVFDYMFMDWHHAHHSNPITVGLLDELLLFRDTLTPDDWRQLAMAIEWSKDESGELILWVREKMLPLIPKSERATIWCSDEYLYSRFDSNLDDNWRVHVNHIFDHPRNDPNFVRRSKRVVKNWFESNRTQRGLEVIAACLSIVGTRDDLSVLNTDVVGEPKQIERIREDARFTVLRRTLN